jgi:hypothetical protein
MKTLILGLIVGVALGYFWGYGEATAGKPNVALRVMNKFGASTVKQGTRRREAAVDSAATTR